MTHILRFHTEIGKMPVVLDPYPWPRLACPWPWNWPRFVCPCPWTRQNFTVLGFDLKVLGLTTTLVATLSHKICSPLFKTKLGPWLQMSLNLLFSSQTQFSVAPPQSILAPKCLPSTFWVLEPPLVM